MIFKSITAEITEAMLRDVNSQQRAATIAAYERAYKELEGDVLNANDVKTYWPQRYRESTAVYNERVKIWTQIPRIICSRLSQIILTGNVETKWVAIQEADQPIADAANELQAACDEANDWEARRAHVYYYALGIGEVANWPEFRRFNKATGEPYSIAGGQGLPIWDYWFPWFVEPISLQDHASEVIGAAKLIFLDGQYATPLLTSLMSNPSQGTVTEVYVAPRFNTTTGKKEDGGFYRKWVSSIEEDSPLNDMGKPDERWRTENLFNCNPVVFFCSPDPDETQYRGKSLVDRFRALSIQHSRFFSECGQAIDVLPNIWSYSGNQQQSEKIVIRKNSLVAVPPGGELKQAVRELNLSEDWKILAGLERLIALAASMPMETWTEAAGNVGKVESGVALKLTMKPLAEIVESARLCFAKSEKEMMRVNVRMFNTYNPKAEIDLSKIRPEIVYDRNIIPVDESVEIVNDLSLLAAGVIGLRDLVKKYNPAITTDEQADNFIRENTAAKQATQTRTIPSLRGNAKPPENAAQA